MNLLPKASGMRPRVACEIAPHAVVAARADAAGAVQATAAVALHAGAVMPGLRPGNLADRLAVLTALRQALEEVGGRPNGRASDLTLVVPDGACRVLLLDFDSLPNKLSEALPLVRFRLKKLVPFDADDAMVSFQIMSQSRQIVRVLAVTMPRDVLAEYETAAREAGFEPGAVLPSTLAVLAAVEDGTGSMVVNTSSVGVTTAIAQSGILLLHRMVDLQREPEAVPANVPPALLEVSGEPSGVLPVVNREDTAGEWARQEASPEFGREPRGPGDVRDSPYAAPTVAAELYPEIHHASLIAPTAVNTLTGPPESLSQAPPVVVAEAAEGQVRPRVGHEDVAGEVAQAVGVAAVYFEDNLQVAPATVLCAGVTGVQALRTILEAEGEPEIAALQVRDVVDPGALGADVVSARIGRGMLAGVLGALRS